ncbi:SIMPL domain-containing protein [bacterium]|nr:SIMPL domain-containing protein [bacterium]
MTHASDRQISRACLLSRSVILIPVVAGVALSSAMPALASAQVCKGTLLQLQVQERGSSATDSFRFSLGLQAEAPSKAAAMALLTQHLDRARQDLKPFALASLNIPAPRSYSYGGSSSSDPKMERATTSLSGEVSRRNYDALIQLAGRLPGVRLQGMTSLTSNNGGEALDDQLLKRALKQGRRRAKVTASALGLGRVELLRINQRGGGVWPVAYAEARMSKPAFRPSEAPQPLRSLQLGLDYCLR